MELGCSRIAVGVAKGVATGVAVGICYGGCQWGCKGGWVHGCCEHCNRGWYGALLPGGGMGVAVGFALWVTIRVAIAERRADAAGGIGVQDVTRTCTGLPQQPQYPAYYPQLSFVLPCTPPAVLHFIPHGVCLFPVLCHLL